MFTQGRADRVILDLSNKRFSIGSALAAVGLISVLFAFGHYLADRDARLIRVLRRDLRIPANTEMKLLDQTTDDVLLLTIDERQSKPYQLSLVYLDRYKDRWCWATEYSENSKDEYSQSFSTFPAPDEIASFRLNQCR